MVKLRLYRALLGGAGLVGCIALLANQARAEPVAPPSATLPALKTTAVKRFPRGPIPITAAEPKALFARFATEVSQQGDRLS